jgi:hypothetical protein
MARSNYIYVVQDVTGNVVAAFTVKAELASWLDRRNAREPRTREELVGVTRVRDADFGSHLPVMLNPRDLEPAA